ncbi:hypothetical protein MIMGU_mgv1a021238mg [Erythranthe guttata]|uniref:Disease resistance protein winged helix domain-containing protein n=1 Tax=Erythranthe guttata TaxID=4155 RepID=A0A022Q666_ERYGU|nr:hypothetical protein MIMGU_mgv1a021238mg [Erythranthe guttata]
MHFTKVVALEVGFLDPCESAQLEVVLVRLWVAEGFIRHCSHKSLEEIGEEYLEELIDRNLVLVGIRSITGGVSICRIHDLLSDVLLRVLDVIDRYPVDEILQLINSRYVACKDNGQTIIVLESLQTLSTVEDLKQTENVIKRIPTCLNLDLLSKLESLSLTFTRACGGEIVFPCSLRELRLSECKIPWEDMSLPKLQVLELRQNAAAGGKWVPNEDEFVRLKLLLIEECELEIWEAEDVSF